MSVFLFSPFFPQRLSSFFFLFFFLSLSLSLPVYCSFRYGNPNLTAAVDTKRETKPNTSTGRHWHSYSNTSQVCTMLSPQAHPLTKGCDIQTIQGYPKDTRIQGAQGIFFLPPPPRLLIHSISPSGGGWRRARLSCFVASMLFIL